MKKLAKKRIYVVPFGDQEYLARAATPMQAARFVAFMLGGMPRLATQDDLIRLVRGNAEIVEAPAEAQAELRLQEMYPVMTEEEERLGDQPAKG